MSLTHERTAIRDPRKRWDRNRGSGPRNRAKRSGNTVSGKRCRSRRRWALPLGQHAPWRATSISRDAPGANRPCVARPARDRPTARARGDAPELDLSCPLLPRSERCVAPPRVIVPPRATVRRDCALVELSSTHSIPRRRLRLLTTTFRSSRRTADDIPRDSFEIGRSSTPPVDRQPGIRARTCVDMRARDRRTLVPHVVDLERERRREHEVDELSCGTA